MQKSTFRWDTKAAEKAIEAATVRGLTLWGEHTLQESNLVVPLDEATLERSGVVTVDAEHLEVGVSYDTPYAVRQHEDETLIHPNGRKAKYLERTWLKTSKLAPQIIANQIRKATKS